MCTKNRLPGALARILSLCLALSLPLGLLSGQPENKTYRFSGSKGLALHVLPMSGSQICTAELVVLTPYSGIHPGISQITYENLFNPGLADGHNSLLVVLRRLGGDFSVINGGDHFRIRVTFLPERLNTFIQFIEKLFTFDNFSQNRFNASTLYYGSRLRRTPGWETQIVHQLAYRHLFPNHAMGSGLVTRDTLKRVKLAHVVTFFRRNFRLTHANLIIKGDVKPYVTFGLVEKAFNNYRRTEKALNLAPPENLPRGHIILFHTGHNSPVRVHWFKVIPPLKKKAHMASLVTEKIMFGMPLGTVYNKASMADLASIRIETDIQDHCHYSVICNTISRLAPEKIHRFILLAQSERRKLALQSVDRKQYLYAVNYLFSRFKVNTASFANDLRLKALELLCEVESGHTKIDQGNFRNIFQQVSLNQVNQMLRNDIRNSPRNRAQGSVLGDVIVITGDSRLIADHLRMYDVQKYEPDW